MTPYRPRPFPGGNQSGASARDGVPEEVGSVTRGAHGAFAKPVA
jgi:hypothetical protein